MPKVTMQDIADATGYSRNTVSKALNANPHVPIATQKVILDKAEELGYKQFSISAANSASKKNGTIALFTHHLPNANHFGSRFMASFANAISLQGYTLTIYMLQSSDIKERRLPANFVLAENDGILCIELFNPEYSRFVCELGLPVLFTDSYINSGFDDLNCDLIMMENRVSVEKLTSHMIKSGAQNIGFVGDKFHCQSFLERYEGFSSALAAASLENKKEYSILADDSNFYGSSTWLYEQLRQMRKIPDGFVCANDYIAISLIRALKTMNIYAPKDISVVGFDDSPEAKILDPRLTTVAIPGDDMGIVGAQLMLDRINEPSRPFETTYLRTNLKFRESSQ